MSNAHSGQDAVPDATQLRSRFLETGSDDDLPIVDPHQHFFDLEKNYYPWLTDKPVKHFRYGNYDKIRRSFLPDDYFRAAGHHRIVKTVLIEGEWDPDDPLGELRWVDALAREHGFPHAMCGHARLDQEEVDLVLDAYGRHALVRGVRHKPTAVAREAWTECFVAPGSMRDPKWRDGYAKLQRHDLHFELQVFWWHFNEAAELARDFPATRIVINHTGLPADRSKEGLSAWRAALERVAREPNVHLKISGICVPGQSWSVESNGPVVRTAIDVFGTQRCSFASNYPVDGVVDTLTDIFDGFKQIARAWSIEDRLRLFHDNAVRVYGL
ncbi:amidohydrolase family protein [Paraburkholderia tagetis]|uniref:Amidohydrolase family protein n=1 Tax=Paraburkholderia tagetis TaxID=2913261 RepID=A0A9X1UCZ1_9BURK|nr:amidohydrolase family protein [Paraburkholderia tagetis]MCG5072084.1 amidohydrolase family protein [Paraburkholderia tagetis]